MRLQRFLVEKDLTVFKLGDFLSIIDLAIFHQLKIVLKMKAGEGVEFFNQGGLTLVTKIISLEKKQMVFEVFQIGQAKIQKPKQKLFLSMLKGEKNSLVLQKAAELGVSEIKFFFSERSEKFGFPEARYQKILKEAVEQSGFGNLPSLFPPVELKEILKNFKASTTENFFYGDSNGEPIKFWPAERGSNFLARGIFVGPEGGFTEKEKAELKAKGVMPISFGEATLRAETAAIVASFLLGQNFDF